MVMFEFIRNFVNSSFVSVILYATSVWGWLFGTQDVKPKDEEQGRDVGSTAQSNEGEQEKQPEPKRRDDKTFLLGAGTALSDNVVGGGNVTEEAQKAAAKVIDGPSLMVCEVYTKIPGSFSVSNQYLDSALPIMHCVREEDDGAISDTKTSYDNSEITFLLAHHNAITKGSSGVLRVHPECIGTKKYHTSCKLELVFPDSHLKPLKLSVQETKMNSGVLGVGMTTCSHFCPLVIDFRGARPVVYSFETTKFRTIEGDENSPWIAEVDMRELCKKADIVDYDFISQPWNAQEDGNGCGPYTVSVLKHLSSLDQEQLDLVLRNAREGKALPFGEENTWRKLAQEPRENHEKVLKDDNNIGLVQNHLQSMIGVGTTGVVRG
jgi:hypothetical protein